MQKQLEKRILEVEKMKQQEQELKRKAVEEVEKQVFRCLFIVLDSPVLGLFSLHSVDLQGSEV